DPGREGPGHGGLCWVGQRLFGAGLNGEITEYDLDLLRPRFSTSAYGGPVWAISSSPQKPRWRSVGPRGRPRPRGPSSPLSRCLLFQAGCEDGTVKMFEILDEGLRFQRNLDRQKGRVLSLSWHPGGGLIAAGMVDMIRIFDAHTGHATRRLLVERGAGALKSREVVVWSLVFLPDHTVVSGDSAGKVQFWDGHTGTLIRSHLVSKWDVLALSATQDGCSLVAGTSEGTVVQFQFISSNVDQDNKDWVRTRTFKNHSHDVRALVHLEGAVVSGGVDTQLVVRPLLDKVEKNTRESACAGSPSPH
ncbi:unnamed protein product, partial [Tetraodon nigroviridis]